MTQPQLPPVSDDRGIVGYDRDRFVAPVDDEFICAICLGVLRKPVQLPCEHMFCEACVKKWIDASRHCPTCRRAVSSMIYCNPPSRALVSLLNKLQIRCHHYAHGCKETLNVTNVDHHERGCDYRPVNCPLPGCSEVVPKNALARHITECDKRARVCPTCEMSLRNGETHSKDDCIAALKRALKDCIGVLVDRTLAAGTSSNVETQYSQRVNASQQQNQNRQVIVAPEHQVNVGNSDHSSDLESAHVSIVNSEDDHNDLWHGINLPNGHVEIDLGSSDSENERDPSLLVVSDAHDADSDNTNDDTTRDSFDSGDSIQSVIGTASVSNASYHSVAHEDNILDNSFEGEMLGGFNYGNNEVDIANSEVDDDHNSSISQHNNVLEQENHDDHEDDGDEDVTTYQHDQASTDDEHEGDGGDSDSEDSGQPKRLRHSYNFQNVVSKYSHFN